MNSTDEEVGASQIYKWRVRLDQHQREERMEGDRADTRVLPIDQARHLRDRGN